MGDESIALGYANERAIQLPLNVLNNHVSIFGRSGSGKTGMIISIVEQALNHDIPCLLIDVKGDLANILRLEGVAHTRRLLTPGASHGDPVNLFAKLTSPDHTSLVVTALLRLMGVESNRTQEAYHLYLTTIVEYYRDVHPSMQLEELLPLILNPGIENLGMLNIDEVLPKAARRNLAVKLNNIIANSSFDLWRQGVSLDFDQLFDCQPGHPACVVFSVAHLVDEEERSMALTMVLTEYMRWTLQQTGTKELRSLMVLDECHGVMPPYPKNPPTKVPLMNLLKQARAFGNGIILGTQNPKDIDYKGLAQCQTWIVGQLKTKNDRTRILEGFSGLDLSPKALDEKMAGLLAREFIVNSGSRFAVVSSYDTQTELTGPMAPPDLAKLVQDGFVYKLSNLLNIRDGLVSMGVDRTIQLDEKVEPKSTFREAWSNLWK
ncbi:MAG: uncharacterized protein JWO15_3583 [Sphingomonadales bacterium]|nr:uncharacterized protein [Sphingomonadales bacterium]